MEARTESIHSAAQRQEPIAGSEPDEESRWGEWLFGELVAQYDVETDPATVDLVYRAAARLNQVRQPAPAMLPVVLWITTQTAFTGPGRYVFLSRELLHRTFLEEAVAFTLAHEMAHHDLGHTRLYRGKLALVRHLPGSVIAAVVLGIANHWLNGPENEAAADARALDLCLAAGYEGIECVRLFDILEADALDHRAIECVFGPEAEAELPAEEHPGWQAAAQTWLWRHRYGYPAIRTRKEALLARLGAWEGVPRSARVPPH